MARILVVDDDEDLAQATAKVLQEEGHEVDVHLDTDSALAKMRQHRPDVVILDVMFPGSCCAGFDFARSIGKEFGPIPILMLSAVNKEFHLGFSAADIDEDWLPITEFVEKPVDFDVLKGKVEQLLQKSGKLA